MNAASYRPDPDRRVSEWCRAVRDEHHLTGPRLLVLWALANRFDQMEGDCSVGQVCRDTGMPLGSVQWHLEAAISAGIVEKVTDRELTKHDRRIRWRLVAISGSEAREQLAHTHLPRRAGKPGNQASAGIAARPRPTPTR